jgi:mRNA interferase RelE/StbE
LEKYAVWLLPSVHQERRNLPGVVRQRIKCLIDELADNPRPDNSSELRSPIETTWEARRIRLDCWRILYVIDDTFKEIAVLAIRKRPPYNYNDLINLLKEVE